MRRKIYDCAEASPIYREILANKNKGYIITQDQNGKWVQVKKSR